MISADHRSIAELIASLCEETISTEELQRLDRLLCTDAEVRRLYIEYLDVHARLSYQFHRPVEKEAEGGRGKGEGGATEGPGFEVQGSGPAIHRSSFVLHPSDHPSSLIPHPLHPVAALQGFASSPILCYAITAVVLCLGVLATLAWKIPGDRAVPMAARVPMRQPLEQKSDPAVQSVGRITRMSGFQWPDEKMAERAMSVSLASEYIMSAGVMEITYNSGAKVVLEGQTRYVVDSPNSGLLLLGKAMVKTAAASGFVMRTPTTTISERGSEFGTWVDASKATHTWVVRGAVALQFMDDRRVLDRRAGDWAWATPKAGGRCTVVYGEGGIEKAPGFLADHVKETIPIFSNDTSKGRGEERRVLPEDKQQPPNKSPDS